MPGVSLADTWLCMAAGQESPAAAVEKEFHPGLAVYSFSGVIVWSYLWLGSVGAVICMLVWAWVNKEPHKLHPRVRP